MTRRARRDDAAPADVTATPQSARRPTDDLPDGPTSAPPLAASRAALLAIALLVAGTFVTIIGGPAAGVVISGWLTDGIIVAVWLLAAWAIGIPFVPRGDQADRTLRHLTAVALGLGVIGLLVFLLGWAGLMGRSIAWTIVAGGTIAGLLRLRARSAALNEWLMQPAGGAWLALVIVPAIAVAAIGARVVPGFLWGDEPNGYDVVSYHLQLPREWFELGRIVPLHHNVFSFMPLGVEMHALLGMHLRGAAHAPGMYLAQMMCGMFALLVPLACYAVVRPLAGRTPGAAAAVLAASAPWITMLGSIAYNEGGLMLYATLAAAHALRGRWAIAGAMAGFAAGCKYTGVTSAILLVPIVVLILRGTGYQLVMDAKRPLNHARIAHATKSVALFAAVALLVFSPWLVRNAIYAGGNPVFPLALRTLGQAHFDAGQVERFEVAHAPRDDQKSIAARATALWNQVGSDWRYASFPLGGVGAVPTLFLLATIAVALRPKDRVALVWLGLIVGNVLVWLFATHLQGRFLVQAIPAAAICATVAAPRFGRAQAVAIIAIAFVAGVIAYREPVKRLNGTLLATIGIEDLRFLWDDDVRRAADDTGRPVALVGDVRPFLLPIESNRVRYRTVFDLPSNANFYDTWVGSELPDDAWAILTPSEADRLARTYRHLPALPDRWKHFSAGSLVVPAGELRRN